MRTRTTLLWTGIAGLVLLGLLRGSIHVQGAGLASDSPGTVFLPAIYKGYPPPPPTFGVQMSAVNNAHGLQKAVEARVHWVRYDAFEWDLIEPQRTTPARYNWSAVDEASLQNAYDHGLTVLATVLFAPPWAQKYVDAYCGPIKPSELERYAAFLNAMVTRYKDPPYNVKYWELGNEPDAKVVPERRIYGCWGEPEQATYGGEAYGEMLKVAYPAIKAADPKAQVLIGGLLLDCDPANPPEGKTCASARFLEGILDAGAGDAFDALSFHGYAHWDGAHAIDEDNPYWHTRGGVVLGKARYLREVLQRYEIDKPMLHTEGSLLYPRNDGAGWEPPDATFYAAQADYVPRLYVRNWANDIYATVWFRIEGPGWRYGGLLDEEQEPKPAYHAYRFMTQELGDAAYQGTVTRYANLEGYTFDTTDKRIWVLWPPQQSPQTVELPASVTHVYDALGQEMPLQGTRLTLSGPVYVEMPR
jgi:hypothetical protein